MAPHHHALLTARALYAPTVRSRASVPSSATPLATRAITVVTEFSSPRRLSVNSFLSGDPVHVFMVPSAHTPVFLGHSEPPPRMSSLDARQVLGTMLEPFPVHYFDPIVRQLCCSALFWHPKILLRHFID